MRAINRLVSLPPAMASAFGPILRRPSGDWFVDSDPVPLGSAGGTAYLLAQAWRHFGQDLPFGDWLETGANLIVHSGGLSRRLPAYAMLGKAMMPIPIIRGSTGQRPDQRLLDVQYPTYRRLIESVPNSYCVVVTSGDVILRIDQIPEPVPECEILCLGLAGSSETASHHGVFCIPHGQHSSEPAFFLQKPAVEQIESLAANYQFLLDTGVWLFSRRAVEALMHVCQWDGESFSGGLPSAVELYGELGLGIGKEPAQQHPVFSKLKCSVLQITGGFYHFGMTGEMIESVTQLHNQNHGGPPLGFLTTATRHADQHVQNVLFEGGPAFPKDARIWVENSEIGRGTSFEGDNVVTGLPSLDGSLHFPHGMCLDVVPLANGKLAIRPYGFEDPFAGQVGSATTKWCGQPFGTWLENRALTLAELAIPEESDLLDAPLFPTLYPSELAADFVQWLLVPSDSATLRNTYLNSDRVSARQILASADPIQAENDREKRMVGSLQKMLAGHTMSVFYNMDLEATAHLLASHQVSPTDLDPGNSATVTKRMHAAMFTSALQRAQGNAGWEESAKAAFGHLRQMLVDRDRLGPVAPERSAKDDQIVWGRSPLRLDLAGGWSDTPPYCLLNGGRVVNVAVDLNGQPPVQVFIRVTDNPKIILRSIDLGTEEVVADFDQLGGSSDPGSAFSLAKIALVLAGFSPQFSARPYPSLQRQLEAFGGGLELSLLAAVPKGSGLGTSSVLAATVLATLSDVCLLQWGHQDVFLRTLALEQILTTGGGWQDQAGGCLHGLKVLQTRPGVEQTLSCRWLPERILGPDYANRTALLYYTGITRMAKSVLGEIVRGMFLNSGPRLETLREIVDNVDPMVEAIQTESWNGFGKAIRKSWELNQRLDSGTNTPEVSRILDPIDDYLLGAKLLGAGGGGYLLMVAKDLEAAGRIRHLLNANPVSAKARFVDMKISEVGLEVTRS